MLALPAIGLLDTTRKLLRGLLVSRRLIWLATILRGISQACWVRRLAQTSRDGSGADLIGLTDRAVESGRTVHHVIESRLRKKGPFEKPF
jgi:hypothetical protein